MDKKKQEKTLQNIQTENKVKKEALKRLTKSSLWRILQFQKYKNWRDAKFGKTWNEWFCFEWSNLFIDPDLLKSNAWFFDWFFAYNLTFLNILSSGFFFFVFVYFKPMARIFFNEGSTGSDSSTPKLTLLHFFAEQFLDLELQAADLHR